MRQEIINHVRAAFNEAQNYFIRENDVQLYLANYFRQTNQFGKIFIEYHVPSSTIPGYLWTDRNEIFIDIVLEKEGLFYPIEIKYKTTIQELPYTLFGQNVNLQLEHHGAKTNTCYDFWKDVKRVELFSDNFQNVRRGISIFLTNDSTYWELPHRPNAGYVPFSIHHGKQIQAYTFLNWGKNLAPTGRPNFSIQNDYNCFWSPMPLNQHRYLIV